MSQTKAQLIDNLVQPIAGAAGSASAPTFSFTADPNTGLYCPGTDQLAVATNGVGRLFVDASGNVGVGLTGDNRATLAIAARTDANALGNCLGFQDASTSSVAASPKIGVDGNALVFKTNSTIYNAAERLRITSAGLVGIGTSSPSNTLHVNSGTANTVALFQSTDAGANITLTDSTGSSSIETTDTQLKIGVDPSNAVAGSNLRLQVDGSTKLLIDSSGNVGIGTTSPNYPLSIQANTSANAISIFGRAADDIGEFGFYEYDQTTKLGELQYRQDHLTLRHRVGYMAFSTGGVTERARIDSSGRFLVGTSTAQSVGDVTCQMQIEGDGQAASSLSITANGGNTNGNAPTLGFGKSRGQADGSNTIVNDGDLLGQIHFAAADGTDKNSIAAHIRAWVDGTPGANDMPGRLLFSTTADGASSPTERMRITSTGAVCINSTDTTMNTFGAIFTPASNTTTQPSVLNFSKTHSGNLDAVVFRHNGSRKGSIQFSDSGTSFNTTSDYRVKENISPLSNAATRLNQLKVYSFNFIADPDTVVDGFLAHEAQAVVPECITGTKDEVDDEGNPVYQGIDQSKLVPLLTAALQEAIGEIESLKARLTAAGI